MTLFNTAASVIVEMAKELADQKSAAEGPLLEGLELPKISAPVTSSDEAAASSEEPAS